MSKKKVKLLHLQLHNDGRRGNTAVLEPLPFEVKRIFHAYNVCTDEMRGGHAHKKCHQLLMATCGAILVKVIGDKDYVLDCPDMALYVPPLNTLHISFLTENATLTVLASELYDINDYVYGKNE